MGGPNPAAHRRVNRVDGVNELAEQPAESDGIAYVLAVAATLDQNDGCVVADRLGKCEAVMLRSDLIFGAIYDEYGTADPGTHPSESVGLDLVANRCVGDGRQRVSCAQPMPSSMALVEWGSVNAAAMKSSR